MSRRTNLAAFMSELGLKQYEVAAIVGLDPITVSRYRRGLVAFRPEHLDRFCEAFKVTPEVLVGWSDDESWDDPFERRLAGKSAHPTLDYR